MTAKLTLTIQDDVIKTATEYAATNGKSLSDIVEAYLKSLHPSKAKREHTFSPRIQRLKGIISLPDDENYKEIVAEEIAKKYLGI